MLKLCLVAALALVGSAGLAQQPQPAPAGQQAEAAKRSDQKLICHTEESTGSRLGSHRVCMTKAQQDAVTRDAADDLNNRTIIRTSPQ